ncbi:TPA: asparagine synthetase A [Enterococcus faecium]
MLNSVIYNRGNDVLKSDWYKKMFRCYSDITLETFKFFSKENFYAANLPITTGSISSPMGLGSDSLPVKINLQGQDTYLADSMQFLLEYALRFSNNGVFYVMPSFRGEDADERHLSQFYHAESEIVGELSDVMQLCEKFIKQLAKAVISKKNYISSVTAKHLEKVKNIILKEKFPEITYLEAVDLLKKHNVNGFEYIDNLCVINSIGEKWLIEYFHGVVWLTHFPHLSVPFYQAYDKNNPELSLSADLLIGIGETLGCGERVGAEEIYKSLEEHEISAADYKWYIDMKQNFPMTTSGFGLGIERFIAWLFDVTDIRTIPDELFTEKNIFDIKSIIKEPKLWGSNEE